MCTPLTDNDVVATESSFNCFVDVYDLSAFDPLSLLIRNIVLSDSTDARGQITEFLSHFGPCAVCEGSGSVQTHTGSFTDCPQCHGSGAFYVKVTS